MRMRTWVKLMRMQLGLTQVELAAKIGGFGDKVISDYERGYREPPADFIGRLALLVAREQKNGRPDKLPPGGMLRDACASCEIGQARSQIIDLGSRRAA